MEWEKESSKLVKPEFDLVNAEKTFVAYPIQTGKHLFTITANSFIKIALVVLTINLFGGAHSIFSLSRSSLPK